MGRSLHEGDRHPDQNHIYQPFLMFDPNDIWESAVAHDSQFTGNPATLEDRQVCSQYPEVEGNYYVGSSGLQGLEGMREAVINGLLGPIDVWLTMAKLGSLPLAVSRVITEAGEAVRVCRPSSVCLCALSHPATPPTVAADIFEDLSPWLSKQADLDFTAIPHPVR
jgi:hypothetical protein